MKMTKIAALLMVLLMVCLPAFAESTDNSLQYILDKGEFVLGLDDSFPPMGFRDGNDIVGFDIDLAAEVCNRLGVKLVLQPVDWSAKEMELDSKNIDCIWNGLSITADRLEVMSMSIPYMNNQMVVVAKDSSGIESCADLAGKKLGVQSGSYAQELLEEDENYADLYASVEELAYDDYLTALIDLQQDGIDAVLIDLVVAEYRIAGLGDDSLVVVDALDDDIFGVGFRLNDIALRDKVNELLKEMDQDGTLAQISTKWFGKDISIVKEELK